MAITITLPAGYSLVVANVVASLLVVMSQVRIVGKSRAKAKVAYPQMYATKEEEEKNPLARKFNCAQRAHANTLENLPGFLVASLITGLKYPTAAGVASFVWVLSRVGYTYGYLQSPSKRNHYGGFLGLPVNIGLLLSSAYVAGQWVVEEYL